MTPQLPRLVLFDVGNVLISLRPWREIIPWEKLDAPLSGDASLEGLFQAFRASAALEELELGRLEVPEFYEKVRRFFSLPLTDEDVAACFLRLLGDEVEGMLELIHELKTRGIRVAGLSDTSSLHLAELQKYPTVEELEVLIASCVTGYRKPHARAFESALRVLRLPPHEVFFTDDREENVQGARAAGMRAEVFRGVGSLREQLALV